MERLLLFLLMALFISTSAANAQDVESSQALKSFSAWSIVHYKDYGGNWEEMWQGWLQDEEVPLAIKERGVQDREQILKEVENLKDSLASFKDQAAESGRELMEKGKSWFEDLKNSTSKEIDEGLNRAIRGE